MALGYEWDGKAPPRVLASGCDKVAERILAEARASNVPIENDAALANALLNVTTGSHVPPELWHAVATVLAFLYRLDAGGRGRAGDPVSRQA